MTCNNLSYLFVITLLWRSIPKYDKLYYRASRDR